jgi:hypothetical protein
LVTVDLTSLENEAEGEVEEEEVEEEGEEEEEEAVESEADSDSRDEMLAPPSSSTPPTAQNTSITAATLPHLDRDEGELARQEENQDEFGDIVPPDDSVQYTKRYYPAPSLDQARHALKDLTAMLRPKRDTGPGYKDPGFDLVYHRRLEMMSVFFNLYIVDRQNSDGDDNNRAAWSMISLLAARAAGQGPWSARRLREWNRAYVNNRESLPINIYGRWNVSSLADEDYATELHLHLQSKGKCIAAHDIIRYLNEPGVMERFGLKKNISLSTACRWMKVMRYQYTKVPTGQYIDGHEREDVIAYRNDVMLPFWASIEASMRKWDKDGIEEDAE